MKHKKILLTSALLTLMLAGIGTSFADFDFKEFTGGKHGWNKVELTDEQKAEIEEKRAAADAKRNVIDKLIDGETLTSDKQALLQEIREERAQRKAEMEEVKTLIEKKKNGEDLTDEEIEKLKELNGKRGFGFHRGGE